MEAIVKKFFDQKLGHFVQVAKENVVFSPHTGRVSLRQAEFKSDVFDQLHFPFALRGGFIEEISVNFEFSRLGGGSPARVVVKNVCLVVGPHISDWSWQHVYECKSKLVDLVMKVYELKGAAGKKKPAKGQGGGYLAEIQRKMIEDIQKRFLGMLEVHVSNIHLRYEDPFTQAAPFACGFKVGFCGVSSQADASHLRATGDWKFSPERHTDPLFSQAISTRRISAYWDIGKAPDGLLASKPMTGQQVRSMFRKLNLRETFSACVVEEILAMYPPEHRKRQSLEGPSFRERLDFHQYVLFPSGLNAHVIANRVSDATRQEKAPLKDADVAVDPMEVAIDTEQVRSVNELLSFANDFLRKDWLMRTRPRDSISQYLTAMEGTRSRSRVGDGSSASEARRECIRAWWHHAFQAVLFLCDIPKSLLNAEDLRQKTKLREAYVSLCVEDLILSEKKDARQSVTNGDGPGSVQRRLREMQVTLPLPEVLEWRLLAKERLNAQRGPAAVTQDDEREEPEPTGDRGGLASWKEIGGGEPPNSLQVRVHFRSFNAYLLVVDDPRWRAAIRAAALQAKVKTAPKPTAPTVRQLVVKTQVLDICLEAVQKGRLSRRLAVWSELSVGSVTATNCCAKQATARQLLSIGHCEDRHSNHPACLFVGATIYVCAKGKTFEVGDTPVGAVLEPWIGLESHLKTYPKDLEPHQLQRFGFLKEYKDGAGRLLTLAFVRMGRVRALDYMPFRRRLVHLLVRGLRGQAADLIRRPSPLALNRELVQRLQRKVEALTGPSNILATVEGIMDGVRARLVEHYNLRHALCKEVSLAPIRWRVTRNGSPQALQVQLQQLAAAGEEAPLPTLSFGGSLGLLPWKVTMLLVPKSDFAMALEDAASEAFSRPPIGKMGAPGNPAAPEAEPEPKELVGAKFWKWGRNGKPRLRFVVYDESISAVAWKAKESDKTYRGAIPLAKIQDICTGIKTPCLKQVRHAMLKADRTWSVVAAERTLDLQAESVAVQQRWVAGLKARYRRHVQQEGVDGDGATVSPALPKALEKRTKAYPANFRPPAGELCTLRTTCKKLQAVSSLGRAWGTTSAASSAGLAPLHTAGTLSVGANPSGSQPQ